MSPCPRMAPSSWLLKRWMLPAYLGEVLGAFDAKNFGVYPHTSFFFLSTLHTCRYRHACKTRLPSPCLWINGLASRQLGQSQLSGRTPELRSWECEKQANP